MADIFHANFNSTLQFLDDMNKFNNISKSENKVNVAPSGSSKADQEKIKKLELEIETLKETIKTNEIIGKQRLEEIQNHINEKGKLHGVKGEKDPRRKPMPFRSPRTTMNVWNTAALALALVSSQTNAASASEVGVNVGDRIKVEL